MIDVFIFLARTVIELVMFAIGISVFSFLNVVIYRLPRKIKFVNDKSRCTSCGHELSYKDMIPIFSWLLLKGKCRYCGNRISARYSLVETIGGLSAVLSTIFMGISWKALVLFIISGILTVIIFILIDKIKGVG